MKSKQVKRLLSSEIRKIASVPEKYCVNPGTDFTRHRKLPLDRLLAGIIGLGGGSLARVLGSGEKGHSESGKKGHFSVREKGPTHQRLFYSDYWLLATVESSFTGFHS